tara:strand:+ start:217 stop:1842 length:1626 start_codon:yes stop_codon:yes gene_type:complete
MILLGKNIYPPQSEEKISFFRGVLVDHEKRDIVLGQNGFSEWNKKQKIKDYRTFEGGFVSIESFQEHVRIQHDCFGLYPVFFYSDSQISIVSDSLFLISRVMKIAGRTVSINKESHLTRAWTYGLACSIMTKETIIQNVFYLPPCSSLTISTKDSTLYCLEEQLDVEQVFASENNYIEDLILAKNEILALVNTVRESTKLPLKLGLSGGLDSRIILALLMGHSSGLEKVHINSNIHQTRKDDYEIAQSLSKKFDFEINQEIPLGKGKPERVQNPFGNFVLFNLGVFDMTYLYRSYLDTPSLIEIGGHGAEISKGTFSTTKLTRKMPLWRPDKKIALYKDLRKSLRHFGVKMNQKNSTQWHHLLYKSAIQNGRYLERTQLSLRPLMNRRLAALGLNNKHAENTVLKDLLILLSPELAMQPFDDESKNIDEIYIESILSESKKYDPISMQKYTSHGEVTMMKNGLLSSFTSLAQQYNLDNTANKKTLLRLLEDTWSNSIDGKLKRVYMDAYKLAKKRLNDEATYLPSAGSPASKIIALGILFD